MTSQLLYGREITEAEWYGEKEVLQQANQRQGFQLLEGNWCCNRCGTMDQQAIIKTPCTCGNDCFYCSVCLNMGKIKKCGLLYSLAEKNDFPPLPRNPLRWKGQLSLEQARASVDIVKTVRSRTTRLIWAVAGAGKTEMIFEGVARCLQDGGRVCIASPRIDVCLELAPRIKDAFPEIPLALLYGGMEDAYTYTPLVIATTHQLLRFQAAFDLLIIDEIDSFPFHNDAALHFGADKAKKRDGALLYLTATPSRTMQKQVASNQLPATILPARYHGYPLPRVECLWIGDWRKAILKKKKHSMVLHLIDRQLQAKRRFLLFLPNIALMQKMEEWLNILYPTHHFTSVSAEDPMRVEKVKEMRNESYDFLMTTTILERGVTFRDIDVFVIGAEDEIFTEASLVQIAGRVGRHKDFPTGKVWFGHYGYTKAIKGAVKQINQMNQWARDRGLLHEDLPFV